MAKPRSGRPSKKKPEKATSSATRALPAKYNPLESLSSSVRSKSVNVKESPIKRKSGRPSKAASEARKTVVPKSSRLLRSSTKPKIEIEAKVPKSPGKRSSATTSKRYAKGAKKLNVEENPLTIVITANNSKSAGDITAECGASGDAVKMKHKPEGLNASDKQQPELMPSEREELKFYYL